MKGESQLKMNRPPLFKIKTRTLPATEEPSQLIEDPEDGVKITEQSRHPLNEPDDEYFHQEEQPPKIVKIIKPKRVKK